MVVELDSGLLDPAKGSLFGAIAETVPIPQPPTPLGYPAPRIDWVGRPEQTNMRLNNPAMAGIVDLRDLWNQQTPFAIPKALQPLFLQRLKDSFAVWDGLDGKADWTPETLAANANVFLDDFLLFDIAKPITDESHLEIEKSTLDGRPYRTGGGRTVNANVDRHPAHLAGQSRSRVPPGRRHRGDQAGHEGVPLSRDSEPGAAGRRAATDRTELGRHGDDRDIMSSTQGFVAEISDHRQRSRSATSRQPFCARVPGHTAENTSFSVSTRRSRDGRCCGKLLPHVAPADEWWVPSLPGWLGIAFTFEGLKALGVPQASLDSFPVEFRQGMAARAAILHDFGANAPANWEYPFGTPDVHVALAIYAKTDQDLQRVLALAHEAHRALPAVSVVYRMRFGELPEGRNPFGFKDGLHNPHVEGSGPAPPAGGEASIKAGEFILGYPDENGETAQAPIPQELRHNGSFIAFRKFHMDVAAFRRYLRAQASSPEEEELLAAKMVGRWRSGAPLVLAPDRDEPQLGS